MIKVGPRTYRAIWITMLVLGLLLIVPIAVIAYLSSVGSVAISGEGTAVSIGLSTALGLFITLFSIRRLSRPLKPK